MVSLDRIIAMYGKRLPELNLIPTSDGIEGWDRNGTPCLWFTAIRSGQLSLPVDVCINEDTGEIVEQDNVIQ